MIHAESGTVCEHMNEATMEMWRGVHFLMKEKTKGDVLIVVASGCGVDAVTNQMVVF